jgi:hypothetical protein
MTRRRTCLLGLAALLAVLAAQPAGATAAIDTATEVPVRVMT